MAQRDLGTAVLNIKIIFQKLNQKDIKEKLAKTLENLEKVFEKSAATALKNAQKTSKTIEIAEKLGKDIVDGLNQGIEESKDKTEKVVTGWARLIPKWMKRPLQSNSPSKVFHQIGLDVVQGFINGIDSNKKQAAAIMRNLASGAKSAFSDEISNLERDLRKVFIKIARLMKDEQKAMAAGKSLSPAKQARLAEFEDQARNIQESIRVAQARSARDPNFRIEDVGKQRAGEIERNTVKLEKQSSAIRKLAGSLSELERTFIKSDGKIKSFGTAVDAAGEKFTKYLTAVVKANKETMTSEQLTNLLAQEKAKLAAAIQASVKNTQLAASMTNRLAQAEKTANELATQAAEKKSAALQKQASDIAKLASKQKTLITAFNQTNKTAQDQENIIDASRAAYDKFFATKVRLNAKLKDEKTLVHDINVAFNQMARELKATIPQGKLLTDLLNELIKSGKGAIAQVRGIGLKDTLTKIGARIPTSDRSTLMGDRATLEELMKSSKLSKNQLQDLEKMLARVNVAIKRIDQNNLANIRKGIHSLTSGVNQFGEQLRRVSFILRDVGRQMMMMMSRRGFGFVKPVIDDFIKFEQSVTDVLAVTGELNNGLTKTDVVGTQLGQTILTLAGRFSFSADQIAETAKQLALAGFSTEQIIGSLESVIQLAAATGSELSVSANIMISSMATFGLEAEHTTRVADVFAATVTRANTNLTQLGEAFKIVAPVAAASGQSIEQVAAALGILANSGLRGTLAGTGLARVLTQLTEKSGKLDAILKPLGSSFDEIDPEKRDFSEIVEVFDRLNLSTATLLSIFEQRAFRSLNALLAQGSARLGSFADQLDRANQVAEGISAARLNTLGTSIQLLSDALTSFRITVGQLVSKELNTIVNFFRDTVINLKELIELNKDEVAVVVRGFIAFLGVLGALGTALFTAGSGAAFLSAPLIAIGAALAAFNALASTATFVVGIFGGAFVTAFASVLAIAATATAVIFGLFSSLIALFSALTISVAMAPTTWGKFFEEMANKVRWVFQNVLVPIYNGFLAQTQVIVKATENLLKKISNVFNIRVLSTARWSEFGETLAFVTAGIIDFAAVIVDKMTPALQSLAISFQALIAAFEKDSAVVRIGTKLLWLSDILAKMAYYSANPIGLVGVVLGGQEDAGNGEKLPERLQKLVDAYDAYRPALAKVVVTTSEFATELGKVSTVLDDLAGAKPIELDKLLKSNLDSGSRKDQLVDIERELDKLNKFREAFLATGEFTTFEIDAQIAQLTKSKVIIESVGKQFDDINNIISGKTSEQISKSLSEGISAESDRLKEIRSIQDAILNLGKRSNAKEVFKLGNPELDAVVDRVKKILNLTELNLDVNNPIQSLMAQLRGGLAEAEKAGQSQLKVYRDLLRILPDLEGLDLNKQEDREKFARSFAQLSEQQEKLKEITDLEESRLDFERQLRRSQMTAHEQRMDDLQEEFKKRQDIFKQLIKAREAEIATIQGDLNIARATPNAEGAAEKIASLENQLEQARAGLKAAKGSSLASFFNALNEGNKENEKRNEEVAKAREDAEMTIMEMRLENEEDVQKRIELRQAIAAKKRKNQLASDIKALEEKFDTAEDKAELDRLKREMEDASRVAGAAEADKIVKEETKEKDKEVNKVVDKRLDLESELLSTLGKQVTTLQQMAALMQFIEALQRRKDRRALQDLRDIAKVKDKIARAEKMAALDGEKGAKGLNAMENLNAELALRMGMMQRNMGVAGVPQVVLNPNAMVNELIIAIRDLTNVIKDFRIGDMAAGIIPGGLNIGAGNRLVGANFGTINHIDNSNKTVNIKTDNPEVAKALAGMKV